VREAQAARAAAETRPPVADQALEAAARARAIRLITARTTSTQTPVRQRARSRWLPSESMIGMILLGFGTLLALLVLAGTIKIGVAP
jgi:hypothetical protein